MDNYGIPLLILAMLSIFVIDALSISYLKTVFLDLRMRKPGFFLGSAGICMASILLSWIMAGAFLQSSVRAETSELLETVEMKEAPKAEVVSEVMTVNELEIETEVKQKVAFELELELNEPELIQEELGMMPDFEVWRGHLKGFSYSFIEVKNGTPYAYMPSMRGDFQSDLNSIVADREGGNVVIMANAGVFSENTEPMGTTIQNYGLVSQHDGAGDWCWSLVVDEDGNVGYVNAPLTEVTTDYIDAKTGRIVSGKKIMSAVYAFVPFVLGGEVMEKYMNGYIGAYRARQIFCVKENSYAIITNTGEGVDGGGWDFNDMVQVAKYRGCLSAFNLDGGGSTATAYRTSLDQNFTIYASTKRHNPTFIVFTADNLAPRGR